MRFLHACKGAGWLQWSLLGTLCKVKQCRRVSKWPEALNDTGSEFSWVKSISFKQNWRLRSTSAAQFQAEQLDDVHQDPTDFIGKPKDYNVNLFPIFKWKALHGSGSEVLVLNIQHQGKATCPSDAPTHKSARGSSSALDPPGGNTYCRIDKWNG